MSYDRAQRLMRPSSHRGTPGSRHRGEGVIVQSVEQRGSAVIRNRNGVPSHSCSCWIGVVDRDHVAAGVAGGFAQVGHGRAGPLERMQAGDGFVFYSPRQRHPDGRPVQAFTAIGRVRDGNIWQTEEREGFRPFRRAIDYLPAQEAPIKPMLRELTFIRSKVHWGAAFRYGFLRVPVDDFARIAGAMGRDFAADFPTFAAPPP
jgi:EVE domain